MTQYINSGSTMLNLALTGNVHEGWPLGRMSNIIGDKSTGKTLLAIEAATLFLKHPPKGIKPKVTYAEAESAFDKAYAESLGMPTDLVSFPEGDERIDTVEKLYFLLEKLCKEAKPGEGHLVIMDSMDSLSSDAEMDREIDKANYGDGKAKKMGELFRRLVRPMEEANVHLMCISQIRENIGAGPFAPKFKRSGGKSLDFYATHILWLAEVGKLKNKKTETVYGIDCQVKVTKNKVSKPFRNVEFPILFAYGTDNISSMVEFLVNKILPKGLGIEKVAGGYYLNPIGDDKLYQEDFIQLVESTPALYKELVKRCQICWDWIEEQSAVQRKPKTDMLSLPDEPEVKKESVKEDKPAEVVAKPYAAKSKE